jgi:preprotein translocase subunit SecE
MVARRKADTSAKKENRIVRYLKDVRAELRRIIWPNQRTTINLTLIVLAVTTAASIALGFIDWVFTQIFAWIIT